MKNLIYRGRTISRVGFFGFGRSNSALLKHLTKSYRSLSFILRSDIEVSQPFWAERTLIGRAARENFCEDILFLSPSVRRDAPEFKAAEEKGLILSSDTEFFFENKKIPVYALTGSDGKSTTAALTSFILGKESYPPAANFGTPLCELLESATVCGAVAELSSFQLMGFSPRTERALITNISENHLDFHTSMEEYISAKENILKFSEKRILNFDCPYGKAFLDKYPAFALFSSEKSYDEIRRAVPANHYFTAENGYVCNSGKRLFPISEILLSGKHNLKNFLAAAALTAELCDTDSLVRAARSFSGLGHRCEKVYSYQGVSFYDSSIDSTPKRTKTTLSEMQTPTVLILGGRGKGLSYSPLIPLPKSVRAVVITGENRQEIYTALAPATDIPIITEKDFKRAIILAIGMAREGDAVLLSPASTSYDCFSDYKERSAFFKEIIKGYYAER